MTIAVGLLVRKKSSHQKMDVDAQAEDNPKLWRCSWIDKDGKLESHVFHEDTLEVVEKKERRDPPRVIRQRPKD